MALTFNVVLASNVEPASESTALYSSLPKECNYGQSTRLQPWDTCPAPSVRHTCRGSVQYFFRIKRDRVLTIDFPRCKWVSLDN